MEDGWLQETRLLLRSEPAPGRTARQALGYQELIQHLEGKLTLENAVALMKISTRQFAKRQHTWFRNVEECTPLEIAGTESPDTLACLIINSRRQAVLQLVDGVVDRTRNRQRVGERLLMYH